MLFLRPKHRHMENTSRDIVVRIPKKVRIKSWGGCRFGSAPTEKTIAIESYMDACPFELQDKSPRRDEREAALVSAWEGLLYGKAPEDDIKEDIMSLAIRSASFEYRIDGYSKAGLGEVTFGDRVLREDIEPLAEWYRNTTVHVEAEDVECTCLCESVGSSSYKCVFARRDKHVIWHSCNASGICTEDDFERYVKERRGEAELDKQQDAAYVSKMRDVLEYLRGVAEDESLGRHRQKIVKLMDYAYELMDGF